MNIDDLSPISRDFFETSKLKMTASLGNATVVRYENIFMPFDVISTTF